MERNSNQANLIHIINGQSLRLLSEKAILWEEEKALILADLHLGKISHFRKNGIAVPIDAEMENFERFSMLLLNNEVEVVYILGDLFHSHHNNQWHLFKNLLGQFSHVVFHLIIGNHDILPVEEYRAENLILHNDEFIIKGFIFTHFPIDSSAHFNICGHIHPGVKMVGKGRQSLRFPCYYISEKQLILPAFGAFTGLHIMEVNEKNSIYIVSENEVINLC
ncbi:MAG: ligase-associated DNA damage response endonuclease PdeM [Saprospiraceae bacterium]|nr:ligase-associated DNA damage response endonuclease PdeM [Saprospiraceae bacterium]